MSTETQMESRSLKTFLFKPFEATLILSALLFMAKIILKSSSFVITWWMIGTTIIIVPLLFAVLFGIIYLVTYLSTYPEER
jgi:hypothetical protein